MKNGKRERRRKQANLAPSSFVLGQKIGPYRARDRRLSRPHGLFRGRIVWEEECVWSWPQNVPLVTFCSCDQTPWREKRHSDTKPDFFCFFQIKILGFVSMCIKKRKSFFWPSTSTSSCMEMQWRSWLRPCVTLSKIAAWGRLLSIKNETFCLSEHSVWKYLIRSHIRTQISNTIILKHFCQIEGIEGRSALLSRFFAFRFK